MGSSSSSSRGGSGVWACVGGGKVGIFHPSIHSFIHSCLETIILWLDKWIDGLTNLPPYFQLVALTAQPGTPFTAAAAAVHPATVDPSNAKGIKTPLCMLASRDEDATAVKKFGEALTGPKHIETFGDQVHGWMAARGDLEDERVRGGYQVLLDFYHRYL